MRRSLLLVVVLLAGCGSDDSGDSGGTTSSTSSGEAVEITATDFALAPDTVTVDANGETTFRLVNNGGTEHALEVEGNGIEEETDAIGPGESAELTVTLKDGEYELYCPIDGHRAMGMEATLVVGGGAAAGGGTTTEGSDTSGDYGYGG
jgi:plastocyanin